MPTQPSGPPPHVCQTCPECASSDTASTVMSHRGWYCICHNCGHAWHEDDDAKSERARVEM
jgi:hypothetical protein